MANTRDNSESDGCLRSVSPLGSQGEAGRCSVPGRRSRTYGPRGLVRSPPGDGRGPMDPRGGETETGHERTSLCRHFDCVCVHMHGDAHANNRQPCDPSSHRLKVHGTSRALRNQQLPCEASGLARIKVRHRPIVPPSPPSTSLRFRRWSSVSGINAVIFVFGLSPNVVTLDLLFGLRRLCV